MSSLRHRLAGLAAARAPARPRRPPASPAPSLGHSVRQGTFSLASRPDLDRLGRVDPRPAAWLARVPPSIVPPLDRWLFLDLETTGLAGGAGTYAFLVGLGRLSPQGFEVRQYFLPDLAAEPSLLSHLRSALAPADVLVTYNGKLFDVPVLETRFRLARLHCDFDRFLHLDLLYPVRRLWRHRGSLRLAELESWMFGCSRGGDVPGALIPRLYFDFLRSGNDRPLDGVFRHNAHDLLTLAALAARLLRRLAAPETAGDPLERFALARWFERARQVAPARQLYDSALAAGLPADLKRAARTRLSFLCKRQREYARAAALWESLLESGNGSAPKARLETLEQLAICYEHRLDDPTAALDTARRALHEVPALLAGASSERYRQVRQRLLNRLRRLARKQAHLSFPEL